MAEIQLFGKYAQGRVVLCDDSDLPQLSKHRWTLGSNGYARTYLPRQGQRPLIIEMHLLLTDAKGGHYFDHINGNRLDNRRCNLRPATAQQNAFNQKRSKNNKSGFKGVRQVKNRFQAVIHHDRKQLYLGSYTTPELAAAAYNGAALALFRNFARLNDLPELEHVG